MLQESREKYFPHVEALIFSADQPITLSEIKNCLESFFEDKIGEDELQSLLQQLQKKYQQPQFAFEIVESGGGYQFLTKKDYFDTVAQFRKQKSNKKLSKATLETLAIIAYKQPVTRLEIDKIRGVNSDYTVRKLLEKELVIIAGKADAPGKPILYRTSEDFLDYFGLNSLADLPKVEDIQTEQPELFDPEQAMKNIDQSRKN